jgi:hypothetical protein
MKALNLPPFNLRTLTNDGKTFVFDVFRKKYVVLTREEWVRQHFLHWLISARNYPRGLVSVEASLKYNRMNKRADAIIYSKEGKPLMIIECKAPEIEITQDVFDQVARYNQAFHVQYLVVTNGLNHYCCRYLDSEKPWQFLSDIPSYDDLI